ncbi:MAG: YkvI family membrane protein [Thermovirgaceae bacterium]
MRKILLEAILHSRERCVENMSEAQGKKKGFFTWFMASEGYKKFILPGLISQSVIIAGGYGTGRELVEYFVNYGTIGGLMGMLLVTTTLWALVFAVSYEFARTFQVYDYRSFFKELLGPGWVLYEICYIVLLLIVLGVVGATSGSIFMQSFGLPPMVGAGLFLVGIAALTYWGSFVIEIVMSWWSYVLYAVFLAFLIVGLSKVGGEISANLGSGEIKEGWALGGFKYAFYNLGTFPAILFALNYIKNRKEAILSGVMTSLITIIPGFFLYLVIMGYYPGILSEEVPTYTILGKMAPWLLPVYMIVLFGTMIETGAGFIHAVNERINSWLVDRKGTGLTRGNRGLLGGLMALIGLGVASFGLIGLIAKGYGTISWGFFILHGGALFTVGLYKIRKKNAGTQA